MKWLLTILFYIPIIVTAKDLFNLNLMKINSKAVINEYPSPPPVEDVARMGRYIIHYSDWCSIAHIAHHPNISGLPVARVYSMSDGPIGKSSGVPYIYNSLMDPDAEDLKVDKRATITVSLSQGNYCSDNHLDPEDPRCAQVILVGEFEYLKNTSQEWEFAKNALFSRHPAMKTWPKSHHFGFGKLNIKNVFVLDFFGGRKNPSVEEYFNANPVHGVVNVEMV